MELRELLGIRPGVTALAGGGGKTTMMYTLAGELAVKKYTFSNCGNYLSQIGRAHV